MKKIILFLSTLVLSCFIFWLLLPQQQSIASDTQELDVLVSQWMEASAIPGMAIARVTPKDITVKAYGKANVEKDIAVSKDTLFNIASISKPLMGIVLLKMVDQGKLDLDRDINDYLPFKLDNPNVEDEMITVRHLASHSSGIADNYHADISTFHINEDSDTSLEEHLRSFLTPEGSMYNEGAFYLANKPGEKRKYSNLGAGLAGYLVKAITGTSLAEYSRKHLFPALGMTNSSWLLNDLDLSQKAIPYEVATCIPYTPICTDTESQVFNHLVGEHINPTKQYKSYHPYPHYGDPQYPDGGVNTSIAQLSQFMALVLKNEDIHGKPLLSQSSYNEMFRLQLPSEISTNQRFFWRDNSDGLTGHMGSGLGVFTAFYFDRSAQTGVIILMNRGLDAKAGRAAKAIAERLMLSTVNQQKPIDTSTKV